MKTSTRGFGLIDLMMAVALLGIAAAVWVASPGYQRASHRAVQADAVAVLLDQEMERMRLCQTLECLEALGTGTIAASLTETSRSWVRADVTRVVDRGPSGTARVRVTAKTDDLPMRSLTALVWVKR